MEVKRVVSLGDQDEERPRCRAGEVGSVSSEESRLYFFAVNWWSTGGSDADRHGTSSDCKPASVRLQAAPGVVGTAGARDVDAGVDD